MPIDPEAAAAFVASHARLLDRRRHDVLVRDGDPAGVLAALDAYGNADGGYGWGLEPDLRSQHSQPIAALHAFDVFAECAERGMRTPRAVELCDWLATVTFDDGGLPFVLPIEDGTACAPWFTGADPTTSSLHGTVAVAGAAWRLAVHDEAVASHPWLARATRHCLDGIAATEHLAAHELAFSLRLLDSLHDRDAGAAALLQRLVGALPPTGALPVEGGLDEEAIRPLYYSPFPGTPLRARLAPELIETELDRLADEQRADGGWEADFASFSPAAANEWRGHLTVHAVAVLAAHGRA